MFSVAVREGVLENLELRDSEANSVAKLAPSRGGMLTRLAVRGRHLLFLDEKSLRDPNANVRGGNPVLFPAPGKLANDTWTRGPHRGSMKQHGFARSLPWEVAATSEEGAASATLLLRSNDATLAAYPWRFEARYTYTLRGRSLTIEQRFENSSDEPMPFAAGFHPYFHVPQADKAATRVETKATRAFDNVAKKDIVLRGIDLTQKEVDLHLYDHESSMATLSTPRGSVTLQGSEPFSRWVIWTVAGKDFVCLEPWTAAGDALNTGEHLLTLEPGSTMTLSVEIRST
ncbi:MAG TPA: galactose mutarotase [Polyangiaceae bacterium]|nr:galactose mutarotase [Polyangiaceae bacterium]